MCRRGPTPFRSGTRRLAQKPTRARANGRKTLKLTSRWRASKGLTSKFVSSTAPRYGVPYFFGLVFQRQATDYSLFLVGLSALLKKIPGSIHIHRRERLDLAFGRFISGQ